jgi:hypothetical protein
VDLTEEQLFIFFDNYFDHKLIPEINSELENVTDEKLDVIRVVSKTFERMYVMRYVFINILLIIYVIVIMIFRVLNSQDCDVLLFVVTPW